MDAPDDVEDYWPNSELVLEHFGVKGMHWGHRKAQDTGNSSGRTSARTPVPRQSEDSKVFDKAMDRVDRGGTRSLSTRELQDVVNRMNLEQQYSRLTAPGESVNRLDQGNDVVRKLLGYGKTINDVNKFMKSPLGKTIVGGVKNAGKSAKVANNLRKNDVVGAALAIIK